MFWIPIDRRELIGNLLFFSTLIFFKQLGSLFRFEASNRVGRSVSEMVKGYYDGVYPNWSKTPDHVRTTWFKCFAVIYFF